VKRRDAPRSTGRNARVSHLADTLAEEMAARSGRLSLKALAVREKPRLRVLDQS
jgi:hypothetical protein